MNRHREMVRAEAAGGKIRPLRGLRVLLDADLSELYGVDTKTLNRALRRSRTRFPADFMFQLTPKEFLTLRCQSGTSRWGGRRHLPMAFTEQGVAMLSSVLRSPRAVRVNLEIMRAFVRGFEALRPLMEPPGEEAKERIGFHRRPGKR